MPVSSGAVADQIEKLRPPVKVIEWIGNAKRGYLRLLAVLSSGLFLLAIGNTLSPTERVTFGLFKYASIYMLSAMLMLIFGYY